MTFVARRFALVPAAAGTLAVAGCGSTQHVNHGQLVSSISRQFAAQGIKLSDIDCPDDIVAKEGTPIHCTAHNASATKLFIDGRVGKKHGKKIGFAVRSTHGIAPGPQVAASARAVLEQRAGKKALGFTCPKEVPIPTRPSVTCVLLAPGGRRYDTAVTVTSAGKMDVVVASRPK